MKKDEADQKWIGGSQDLKKKQHVQQQPMPQKEQHQQQDAKDKDQGKQAASKVIGTKTRAIAKGGAGEKAKEKEAIDRILKKRKPEAPQDADVETDEELIEL